MKTKKSVSFQEENTFYIPSLQIGPVSHSLEYHSNFFWLFKGISINVHLFCSYPFLSYEQERIIILQFNEVTRKKSQVNSKKKIIFSFQLVTFAAGQARVMQHSPCRGGEHCVTLAQAVAKVTALKFACMCF